MHKLFSEWYRLAEIEPSSDMLEKRWQGIESFLDSVENPNSLLELVRIYFFIAAKDEDVPTKFRQSFIDADSAFPYRDNDVEMSVLAAAALAECIEEEKFDNTYMLAQSLCCYVLSGLREPKTTSELINIGANYLKAEAKNTRQYEECSKVKPPLVLTQHLESIKKQADTNSIVAAWPVIATMLSEFRKSLVSSFNAQNKNIETLDSNLDVQREENDILWWLYGECSRDLETKFSDLDKPGVSLVLAREMSDLTRKFPGPVSSKAFLDKALSISGLSGNEKISIKDAVNSTDRSWREEFINSLEFEMISDFCPAHLAIEKSLETDGGDDWMPIFKKASGVDPASLIVLLDLAMQFYLENLLIKSISE